VVPLPPRSNRGGRDTLRSRVAYPITAGDRNRPTRVSCGAAVPQAAAPGAAPGAAITARVKAPATASTRWRCHPRGQVTGETRWKRRLGAQANGAPCASKYPVCSRRCCVPCCCCLALSRHRILLTNRTRGWSASGGSWTLRRFKSSLLRQNRHSECASSNHRPFDESWRRDEVNGGPKPPGGLYAFEQRQRLGNPWVGQPLVQIDMLPIAERIIKSVQDARHARDQRTAHQEILRALSGFCIANVCDATER